MWGGGGGFIYQFNPIAIKFPTGLFLDYHKLI